MNVPVRPTPALCIRHSNTHPVYYTYYQRGSEWGLGWGLRKGTVTLHIPHFFKFSVEIGAFFCKLGQPIQSLTYHNVLDTTDMIGDPSWGLPRFCHRFFVFLGVTLETSEVRTRKPLVAECPSLTLPMRIPSLNLLKIYFILTTRIMVCTADWFIDVFICY